MVNRWIVRSVAKGIEWKWISDEEFNFLQPAPSLGDSGALAGENDKESTDNKINNKVKECIEYLKNQLSSLNIENQLEIQYEIGEIYFYQEDFIKSKKYFIKAKQNFDKLNENEKVQVKSYFSVDRLESFLLACRGIVKNQLNSDIEKKMDDEENESVFDSNVDPKPNIKDSSKFNFIFSILFDLNFKENESEFNEDHEIIKYLMLDIINPSKSNLIISPSFRFSFPLYFPAGSTFRNYLIILNIIHHIFHSGLFFIRFLTTSTSSFLSFFLMVDSNYHLIP